jgi:hypothetical protein
MSPLARYSGRGAGGEGSCSPGWLAPLLRYRFANGLLSTAAGWASLRVLAKLAESRTFFALFRHFVILITLFIYPLVVYDHQESSGKTGYSAPVSIEISLVEEWQESAIILLNLARSGILGTCLRNIRQHRQDCVRSPLKPPKPPTVFP